jgi:hypothetical protein
VPYDLVVQGSHVLDPSQNIDGQLVTPHAGGVMLDEAQTKLLPERAWLPEKA